MSPSLIVYDDYRVGLLTEAGAAYDVCGARHDPVPVAGPDHARVCICDAAMHFSEVTAMLHRSALTRVRPQRLRSPAQRPTNVFGAPVNYTEHRGELEPHRSPAKGTVRELGLFVKASGSVSGPAEPVELPVMAGREFHYEGEIAVLIGVAAEDVRPSSALDHVAGFTGALDITLRLETDHREERSMRKSYKTFTPIGPALMPLDRSADRSLASTLSLSLSINGEERQRGHLGQLIMPVAELVSLASSVVPLQPGDVILTGTPQGVGPLSPGDQVAMQVAGLPPMTLSVVQKVQAAAGAERGA